jgi:uncharacterized protein (DUF2141 family)
MRAIAAALLVMVSATSAARAAELTVNVDNVRSGKGTIHLSLFAAASEWPDNSTREHDRIVPAQPGRVVIRFDLPPGIYAANGYHDENGNGKLDTNFLGIPEEGYMFSNDVRPVLSAPSFESASFRLPPEGGAITIHLVY